MHHSSCWREQEMTCARNGGGLINIMLTATHSVKENAEKMLVPASPLPVAKPSSDASRRRPPGGASIGVVVSAELREMAVDHTEAITLSCEGA